MTIGLVPAIALAVIGLGVLIAVVAIIAQGIGKK